MYEAPRRPREPAGATRHELLRLLLEKKEEGLTIEQMSAALGLSRNAIRQHITALERDGLVEMADTRRSIGRPSQVYTLTAEGIAAFPKQYSWFSGHLLTALKGVLDADGLRRVFAAVADRVMQEVGPLVRGQRVEDRVAEVAAALNRLQYIAESGEEDGRPVIRAVNCVYHDLAREHPEVCELDVELISRLTGAEIEHRKCMARGDGVCCFAVVGERALHGRNESTG